MLFPYKYVPHQMEKMQEFIDYIFHEVWCKAPNGVPFDLNLFSTNPDLHEVMQAFYYSDAEGAEFFYGHIERIYGHFATLTPAQIDQFKAWYDGNNDIERVCENDPAAQVVRYADIYPNFQVLCQQLSVFFRGLYSKRLLNLAVLRQKIGDIDDHYEQFMTANATKQRCPFCGLADMLGPYHSYREAYDHYLPKALYPFNSINFKNLVPACHHCNSTYKGSQNLAYAPKDPAGVMARRKVFYPYTTHKYKVDLRVELKSPDMANLQPNDVDIKYGPAELTEEIETWRDVYGIDERYKAKCCSEGGGYWLAQIFDEWKEDGRSPKDFLRTLSRQTNNAPFSESNFLKLAFLEGCSRIGMFDVPGNSGHVSEVSDSNS